MSHHWPSTPLLITHVAAPGPPSKPPPGIPGTHGSVRNRSGSGSGSGSRPGGSPDQVTPRKESLAHLWRSLAEEIEGATAVPEMPCEILDTAGSTWISVVAVFDGSSLRFERTNEHGTDRGLERRIDRIASISLPGANVVGHLIQPYMEVIAGPDRVLIHCPEGFKSLVAMTVAGSRARPEGLAAKAWRPPPPRLDNPESDMLICKLDAHFTAYSPHSKAWQSVVGRLRRSGLLELFADGGYQRLFALDMTRVNSSAVRRVDTSLVKCPWVLFVTPDLGGPDSVYLKFSNDDDFEDWMVSIKFFTPNEVYASLDRNPKHCMRVRRSLRVHISSARFNAKPPADLSCTYVDVSFDDWIWARTALNSDSESATWGQDFEFPDLGDQAPPLELTLRRTDGTNRPTEIDPPIGKVIVDDYGLTSGTVHEQWYPLDLFPGASLYVTTVYTEAMVLDGSLYKPLQRQVRDLARNVSGRLVDARPRILPTVCRLFTDLYRAEGRHTEWILFLVSSEVRKQAQNASSSNMATLFRGNSLLTRSFERYMYQHGQQTLKRTVGRFVRKLLATAPPGDETLELDPMRLPGATSQQLETNRATMVAYVSYMWSLIQVEGLPPVFHVVFHHLREELLTQLKATEKEIHASLAAFVFLRFYCPALLNPRLFQLTDTVLTPRHRRTVTLVAKIIQGFASGVRFGTKEPWLVPLNDLLERRANELATFYTQLCDYGGGSAQLERVSKALPMHKFMHAELTNPYLVDSPAAYATMAQAVVDEFGSKTDNTDDIQDILAECQNIVNATKRISEQLVPPDDRSSIPRPLGLHSNLDTLLFGLDEVLINANNGPNETGNQAGYRDGLGIHGGMESEGVERTRPERGDHNNRDLSEENGNGSGKEPTSAGVSGTPSPESKTKFWKHLRRRK